MYGEILELYTGGPAAIAVISSPTPASIGQTALLTCVGSGRSSVGISWSFNDATLANTSLVSIYDRDFFRGGRNFKQSFLQLCSVDTPNGGEYTCTLNSGLTTVDASTQLTG